MFYFISKVNFCIKKGIRYYYIFVCPLFGMVVCLGMESVTEMHKEVGTVLWPRLFTEIE